VVAAPPLMEVPGALTSEVVLRITKPHRSSYVQGWGLWSFQVAPLGDAWSLDVGALALKSAGAGLAFGTRGGIDGLGRSDRSFWR